MGHEDISARGGWTRRQAIKGIVAGAAACALPRVAFAAKPKRIPIGIQLYSVRGDAKKDFDAAMERVAKMGYEGFEFAGYFRYGGKARELKRRLDDLGVKAAGTHIGTGSLRGDNLKRTIEFHKQIGCKFLIVPGDGAFTDPERSKQLAETFNKAAEILKPHGMHCGYHNHTKEFKKYQGKTYWEWFAERTSKDVVLQQDVGWTTHARQDPVLYIKKYPGRTKTTHFKPTALGGGKKPIIGQDSVDWENIILACYYYGGTEWFIVEQERYLPGKSPMECSEMSLAGLKSILKRLGA